jgi:guanylate kinase
MGNIFYLMGKSSSGKDTIYQELLRDTELNLKKAVLYTTRPIRAGETDGITYHFTDEAELLKLQKENKVIEVRGYDTIKGMWYYFTVDDGQFETDGNIIMIGTLESYEKMREHFGERVVPVFVTLEDGERLIRAIRREQRQKEPMYAEMCRRFLADEKDFSKEMLAKNKIERFFENNQLEQCVKEIKEFMKTYK